VTSARKASAWNSEARATPLHSSATLLAVSASNQQRWYWLRCILKEPVHKPCRSRCLGAGKRGLALGCIAKLGTLTYLYQTQGCFCRHSYLPRCRLQGVLAMCPFMGTILGFYAPTKSWLQNLPVNVQIRADTSASFSPALEALGQRAARAMLTRLAVFGKMQIRFECKALYPQLQLQPIRLHVTPNVPIPRSRCELSAEPPSLCNKRGPIRKAICRTESISLGAA